MSGSTSMLSQRGINVRISSGRDWLPMYRKEVNGDGNIGTAYISSAVGKHFGVSYENTLDDTSLSLSIYIDGQLARKNRLLNRHKTGQTKSLRTGHDTERPLQFSKLQTTDADDGSFPQIDVSKLGVIEIRVWRVTLLHRHSWRPKPLETLESGAVSEKSKKAGWHSVSLGVERKSRRMRKPPQQIRRIDPKDNPWLVFRIHYQPEDLLRAQGIISQPTRSTIANATRIPKDEPSTVKPSKHSNRIVPHRGNEDTRSKLQKLKPDPIHDEDVIIIESSDDDGGAGLKRKQRVKYERAPISAPSGSADVIDLTLD